MKLGKVYYNLSYIVDLDDSEMIEHAKNCFYDDIMNAVKYDEVFNWIEIKKAPKARKHDIPDFLKEKELKD